MCLVVGDISCLGQIIAKLVVSPEVTPLQQKLEEIATDIGKGGTYIALLIVHVISLPLLPRRSHQEKYRSFRW